jgi:pimeloyl-ACP methyl ester carboxylesterase
MFVTGQVVKHKGSLYGKTSYNRFIFDFLMSPEYTLKDLLNRQKGSLQSIKYLWQEVMLVNFEDIIEYEMPVTFIQGRGDYHVSSALVHEYFTSLKSHKNFYWLENSCHFPQWSEPQKFYEIMKSIICT